MDPANFALTPEMWCAAMRKTSMFPPIAAERLPISPSAFIMIQRQPLEGALEAHRGFAARLWDPLAQAGGVGCCCCRWLSLAYMEQS